MTILASIDKALVSLKNTPIAPLKMKKSFLHLLICTAPLLALVSSARAQVPLPSGPLALIPNGSFEANPGASQTSAGGGGANNVVDSTTFTDFRFYNVSTPALAFTAQDLNTSASAGSYSLRMDINNPNGVGLGNYGFDTDNNHLGVLPNTQYEVSFDAAYIGGGDLFTAAVAEYTTGTYNGGQTNVGFNLNSLGTANAADTAFHTYTLLFTTGATTNNVNLLFGPASGQVSANALYLDNIQFGTPTPEPGAISMVALAGVVGFFLLKKRNKQALA